MKKKLLLFILIWHSSISSYAQFSRYIIQLKDKAGTTFSISTPSQFLSQRAIDRRLKYNIPITETDLPVNQTYIEGILAIGNLTILNVSKWFNQVCILTTDPSVITKIKALPFVQLTNPIAARRVSFFIPSNKLISPGNIITKKAAVIARPQSPTDVYDYGLSYPQTHLHNAEFLHNHGFSGEGMQIAIMDAGFFNYKTLPTFDSVNSNNQVLDTWDFVANKASVNEEHPHGMYCFSTIAANMPGTFVGTAPKASFYLFRTEDVSSEYPVEEQNFAVAAERADSLGVDAISVSLGYNTFSNSIFDYTYDDMNGKKTLIARAVNFAAQKGMTVIVSAGNDGNNSWHFIATPADADSALTVGAVNNTRQVAGFSSYGPSSNGQIKPDVAAVGAGAMIASSSTGLPVSGNGTSFACPIIAGIATCLWQAFPEVNNRTIVAALRKSSDNADTPDDRTGYGIPDVKKAFVLLQKKNYTQQIAINNNCKTILNWSVKTAADMNCVIERKMPVDSNYIAIDTQFINSSFSKKDFTFTDDLATINPGISIKYRIKMNIAKDTSFYLDSATLNYYQACKVADDGITISPNPVTDKLSVKIIRNNQVQVSLVLSNTAGQQLYFLNKQKINRQQVFTIPMSKMSRGVYYVTVLIDGEKAITKKIFRD